jgi:gluconate 5-dehydrogenase
MAGASIAIFDLRDVSETVELVKKTGVSARGWELDASDTKALSSAVDQVEKELGPIRVLVNVQGRPIIGSRPVVMENYENFWKTMEINTGSVQ